MNDVYTQVTNRIITMLEEGTPPWKKPWGTGHMELPRRHNGEPYHGVNTLLLWAEALDKGYGSPTWMTAKQAEELHGQVKPDQTKCQVVFVSQTMRPYTDAKGEEKKRPVPFMRSYFVYNVEQIEGLPDSYYAQSAQLLAVQERNVRLEAFFSATQAKIFHGGNRACYVISRDEIHMPPFEAFPQLEGYYATLAHETVHWTRHPSRLNRDMGRKKWGDEGYAKEELVAELGSAFLCAALQITPEVREDHAAYVGSWLEALKGDKRFIFTAASHAQKAADYLQSLGRKS